MNNHKNLNIAVLMGGPSRERKISLCSGKNVLNSLLSQGYKASSFDTGPNLVENLKKAKIDVVYIALHGEFGEDGQVQAILDEHGLPYTGSGARASRIAMHKVASKKIWLSKGVNTPKFTMIDVSDIDKEIERLKKDFVTPAVVKPTSEGSSLGVSIVHGAHEFDKVIRDTSKDFKDIFVEQYIAGQEVTVGILKNEALPVLELLPKKEFYDFEAKYTEGLTDFILPARLEAAVYALTQKTALAAHRAIGCRGFSRVDLIVDRTGVPHVTEINTIPGMTDRSDLPAQAAHAGISFDELVRRILESAFE